ncbi:hypothetical protein [Embleya sp. NBC_00896]|uniref:hypothetical protein n=1 Tax=Embleya sp. NBC_00896 TaxID=2975961 RepID=UPI00386B7B9D|nr:CHAT domain-containing protein [Embleya sp. NBC_00896]
MPASLPVRVVDDPSDGFRRLPHLEIAEPDLRVSFDVLGGDRIRARMSGPAVPALAGGEHRADLAAHPGEVRAAGSRLCRLWEEVFVDHQPTDTRGRPEVGRIRPFATAADLVAEPEEEVRAAVDELVREGASVLFDVLLAGDDPPVRLFRSYLTTALAHEGLRVRFDSPDLHLPWPMLCLGRAHTAAPRSTTGSLVGKDSPVALVHARSTADVAGSAGPEPQRAVVPMPTDRPADAPLEFESRSEPAPEPALEALFDLFLGHRHQIEHTGDAYPWIRPLATTTGSASKVSVNHDPSVGPKTRAPDVVKKLIARPGSVERTTHRELVRDLRQRHVSDEFMYFWVHGSFEPDGASSARLVIRLNDGRTIDAGTIREARARHRHAGTFRPFILLNACHGGTPADADHAHLARALIEHGAQGVLGPTIRMPQAFAAEYALAFVTRYLHEGATAGTAARDLARDFAARYRNPLGLAYALHCGMDTRLPLPPSDTAPPTVDPPPSSRPAGRETP